MTAARAIAPNGVMAKLIHVTRAAAPHGRHAYPLRGGWSWVVTAPNGIVLGDVPVGRVLPDFEAIAKARRGHRKIPPAERAALAALRHAAVQLDALGAGLDAPFTFRLADLTPVTVTPQSCGYRGGRPIPRFGADDTLEAS